LIFTFYIHLNALTSKQHNTVKLNRLSLKLDFSV
jgi:hypothetical protein